MKTPIIRLLPLIGSLLLAGCGTTYSLPEVTSSSATKASEMFAQERAKPFLATSDSRSAQQRFHRVVARVKPVAEAFCRQQADADRPKTCELPIKIDTDMAEANAYHTRDAAGKPYIAVSAPMLLQIRNDDELAFILGHEYAHHIADHIDKQQQQAVAGALILGAITAAGQAYATQANPYRYTGNDSAEINRSMNLGAAAGTMAYSQSYELESDVVATHITSASGYDAINGAKFFARPASARTTAGKLSFWGTHPPDTARLATVIEARTRAASGQGLMRKK